MPDIEAILFNDYRLEKCSKCGWVRLPYFRLENFVLHYMQRKNFCNSKKADSIADLSDEDKKVALAFLDELDVKKWNARKPTPKVFCSFCSDELIELVPPSLKSFKMYSCGYCGSLYFKPQDLEKALEHFMRRAKRKQGLLWLLKKWIEGLF